ncbi:MAG: GntR family transcriptional regulator [Gammaproteobacteria bacterium]
MFVLKPHSGVPLHRQLDEQIRRLVASGQLAPGTALPSIRELALAHTINPMTVSKVYTRLEAEGVLERNRGKPMTVAAQRRAQAPHSARLAALDAPLEHLVLAARQLELDADAVIEALRKKWETSDAATVRGRARPHKGV